MLSLVALPQRTFFTSFLAFCLFVGLAMGIFPQVEQGTQLSHLKQNLEKAARSPANFSLDFILSEGIQEF